MSVSIVQTVDFSGKKKIFRFLYDVWSVEFSRTIPGMDHGKKWVKDDLDDWARHFMALDDAGRMVACLRINLLHEGVPDEQLASDMQFGKIVKAFGAERSAYTSRLAVIPSQRGGMSAFLLMKAAFRLFLEEGILVNTSYCQLGLVHLYYQLGFRPYAPNFRIDVGVRTPLIGCVRDRGYLKKTGSPLLRLLEESMDDHGAAAGKVKEIFPDFHEPGFDRTSSRETWARLAHDPSSNGAARKSRVFENIPDEVLAGMMNRLVRLRFAPGEVVYRRGEYEKSMGVLLSGKLGVSVGGEKKSHTVGFIEPGEPFGELSALGPPERTADVKALEKSEAILLPMNLFELAAEKHPRAALQLSMNMLSILAERIAESNKRIIDATVGVSPPRAPRPAASAAPRETGGKSRVESYDFATLDDRGAEYERLALQASAAEDLELSMLKRVGLADGMTVLDLGSGPGLTAALLAGNFPSSRIIGVEPEKQLRDKAEAHVRDNHIRGCDFLDGAARDIPLPDDSVDFSYARLLFQHIPDRVEALLEMKRVTREDGIVCVVDVDDGTLLIHPEPPEWSAIEKRVARAQAAQGGDRHVGRKLPGYMRKAGISNVAVDIVPITSRMLGPKLFGHIVLGFKRQILARANDLDEEANRTFDKVLDLLRGEDAFASENMFVVHGKAT